MDLPPTIAASLVRGIGVYLRNAPSNEIPASLRRFRGFRPQALTTHRTKLIAALDNEDLRNDILEWLDQSPRINKEDARVLAIAVQREDGWEQALAGSARAGRKKPPPKSENERLREALQRERDRVAALKEDLRTNRDATRQEIRSAKQRVSETGAELRDVRARLHAAEVESKSLRTELERAARVVEKEKRALRRDSERASRAQKEAEQRVTSLKRDVAALTRQKADLERRLHDERAKSNRARKRSEPPSTHVARRRRLKAPKGLVDDAPETLRAWLSDDGVRLLVDGYNVGKARRGFPDLELEGMRKRVVDEVAKLARKYSIEAVVVFDGAEVSPGTGRRTRGPVRIQYSRAGTSADDHIVDLVRTLPPDPVVVATNDRELQRRVAEHRATVATSDQLLSLIR